MNRLHNWHSACLIDIIIIYFSTLSDYHSCLKKNVEVIRNKLRSISTNLLIFGNYQTHNCTTELLNNINYDSTV